MMLLLLASRVVCLLSALVFVVAFYRYLVLEEGKELTVWVVILEYFLLIVVLYAML